MGFTSVTLPDEVACESLDEDLRIGHH